MPVLDLVIVALYLVATVVFGAWFSTGQRDVKDYFVSGRSVPWWAITGSIVATETSTVTFISVPGVAYTGNWTFLQLVMGYMLGRIAVSIIFVPAYFRGELITVYQLLGVRFGGAVKRLAAGIFLLTRSLADGVRLFATGLVLAALLLAMPGTADVASQWAPGWDPTLTILRVVGVRDGHHHHRLHLPWRHECGHLDRRHPAGDLPGRGGGRALHPPGSHPGRVERGRSRGLGGWQVQGVRLHVGRRPQLHLLVGVIGGAFLTTATHGTDQLMVQRYSVPTRPGRRASRSCRAASWCSRSSCCSC